MKWLVLAAYLLTIGIELALTRLNLDHQKRCTNRTPPEFAGRIDGALLKRSLQYAVAKTRLAVCQTLTGTALLTIFLFGPWLAPYDHWIGSLSRSFITGGLLFFLILLVIGQLLAIPFDLFRNFVIETRYGFNRMTLRLWLSDQVKSLLLSLAMAGLLAAGSLWLIQVSPDRWWLWVWLFVLGFGLFFMVLSPHLIEPLFHRFTPLDRPELETRIKDLAARAGIITGRIFQIDASRRSGHANAFFSGFGRQKRIVLFDTLLQQMTSAEILAVLAHEMGHWHHRHLPKRLLSGALGLLAVCYAAYRLLAWGGLPLLVGQDEASFAAQVLVLLLLYGIAGFFIAPLSNGLSRRQERQADRFAVALTRAPESLAEALIKLGRNNLANLCPHPWYAWYHYSHPPLAERVRSLQAAAEAAQSASSTGRPDAVQQIPN
jgi:STE24 endopeptidase